jgi:uncharacterized membrane protein YfcA
MSLIAHNLPWLFLTGTVAGVLGAILGIGGGVLLVPVLVLVFHMPMHHAVASSIISVIATSSAVASANVDKGLVNMRLGMVLEVATVLGGMLGALTAGWLSGLALMRIFAVAVVVVAIMMGWKAKKARKSNAVIQATEGDIGKTSVSAQADLGLLGSCCYDPGEGGWVVYRIRRPLLGFMASLVAGNVSGLLGVGGGWIKVPVINMVCGVPMKAATATSNFMIGVTAASSAFIYYGRGDVRPVLTAAVILGVLAGSFVGSLVNQRLSGRLVQTIFAVFLLLVAWQMFMQAGPL